MRALHFDGALKVVSTADPIPSPGEALIAVTLAGICNTDIEISRGYMGFRGVLGHEFVGLVEAVGDPSDSAWLGRRVVGEINLGCGNCSRCEKGLVRHCAARSVLGILHKDGAMAERVTLPLRNLHTVPDGVSDAMAVFTEPVAACFEITEQLHLAPDTRIAILGDGKLGQLVAQVLSPTSADLTLVGRHASKLSRASSRGVRTAMESDALAAGSFDTVIEATGSEAGLSRALDLVRPRGTVVLKSTFHGATTLAMARVVIDEVTLVGSRCGPFAPALRALEQRRVDPTVLIDATAGLSDAVEAFAEAQRAGVLKVLIDPRR